MDDKFKISVDDESLKSPNETKKLAALQKTNPNIEFDLEKDKNTSTTNSTSMVTQMEENAEPEAIIEPQDQATIKYLSNVKDSKTGEFSKPFNIDGKNYQMIRGLHPTGEIGLAVFCHDDVNENGENIIHSVNYFEETIAKPMKEAMGMVGQNIQVVEDGDEIEPKSKEAFMDYLNLSEIEPMYKHFFVNLKTGEITGKFRSTKEMVKSGVKLGPEDDYMDRKKLKQFRFRDYFKNDMNEVLSPEDAGTNVDKLQSDVKRLASLIKNKFSVYISKLDKPIEQAQFLTAMAKEIGVPLNKLSTIINSYKDIAAQDKDANVVPVSESKIITKNFLEKKVKDIKK